MSKAKITESFTKSDHEWARTLLAEHLTQPRGCRVTIKRRLDFKRARRWRGVAEVLNHPGRSTSTTELLPFVINRKSDDAEAVVKIGKAIGRSTIINFKQNE